MNTWSSFTLRATEGRLHFDKPQQKEHVECDALKDWKLNIFKIIDRRISFYSQNTNMLSRKPKITYRYLKSGIEEFHRKYVLVPADKAANNVVVV